MSPPDLDVGRPWRGTGGRLKLKTDKEMVNSRGVIVQRRTRFACSCWCCGVRLGSTINYLCAPHHGHPICWACAWM